MDYRKFKTKRFWVHIVTTPIILLPLPIIIIMDLVGEFYHHVYFPIYGIEKVKRSEYIQIVDRAKLQYLNFSEKIGCMYCGYTNGLLRYFKEIAGRTEKYWCGIVHQNKPGFKASPDQSKQNFARFGDEADFKKKYPIK